MGQNDSEPLLVQSENPQRAQVEGFTLPLPFYFKASIMLVQFRRLGLCNGAVGFDVGVWVHIDQLSKLPEVLIADERAICSS